LAVLKETVDLKSNTGGLGRWFKGRWSCRTGKWRTKVQPVKKVGYVVLTFNEKPSCR